MPYLVFIDTSKNPAVERSMCEECEEVHDHGGDTSRQAQGSPPTGGSLRQPVVNSWPIEGRTICGGWSL
jgi:hypothetical protein